MQHLKIIEQRYDNPVDVVENVAENNDWTFERTSDYDLSITADGTWSDYALSFSWLDEHQTLHLACNLNVKTIKKRQDEILNLITIINEQMIIGHFGLWLQDETIMFRHAMPFNGGAEVYEEQIEFLMSSAVLACERYYQAFQFVLWANQSAQTALDNVLFETVGEA